MGANNQVTPESKYRRMQKNAKFSIDYTDNLTIRRLLLEQLTHAYRTIQEIIGVACPLSRTSIGRWETMLKELVKEKLIVVKWGSIPLYIEIKKATSI